MAYVRKRGNQLAIVRGVRDAATGKVEQQILLTLYSREEAREALGPGAARLQRLLRGRFPGLTLSWDHVAKAISGKLDQLPETHERRTRGGRPVGREFRQALAAFTRELGLADPQSLSSAAELIRRNVDELRFVRRLIDWRLKMRRAKPNEATRDPFGWGLALEERRVPLDVSEMASTLYESGEHRKARAAFRLLLDAFGEDADAHNSLGLIALGGGKLEKACREFEKAAAIARRAFPRKLRPRQVAHTLEARPYLRALRNLALAQNEARRHGDVLATCERLEKECNDLATATSHRATVALNTGEFARAVESASLLRDTDPEYDFVVAFAAHELGRSDEALASFLHASLSNRRAARLLLGDPVAQVESSDEAEDQDGAESLVRILEPYVQGRGKGTIAEFRKLRARPALAEVLSEMEAVVRRCRGDKNSPSWRTAFERMERMRTFEFAQEQAKTILADA